MKIASWNVNGIRACIKKGFWDWFEKDKSDIVCLQETKITAKDFRKIAHDYSLTPLIPEDGELDFTDAPLKKRRKPIYYALATAEKAGYSGVLLLSKIKPKRVVIGLDQPEYDREGRTVMAEFDDFMLVNTYVPNGGRELERIPYKLAYSDHLLKQLQKWRKKQKHIVICGDMNVAHQEIDIKNAKSNQKNSGFTPIEREWFTQFLDHKFIDSFRFKNPDKKDVYSWWSYRPGVRAKNVGWRIDYFVTTSEMQDRIKKATVQMEQMGSDHCPIHLVIS